MQRRLVAACLMIGLLAAQAAADPLSDAKAGLDALNRGDNDTAIRLFTQAINSGALASSDLELAYVKRARAYSAARNSSAALADLVAAAKLDPSDQEIAALRRQLNSEVRDEPSLNDTWKFIIDKLSMRGAISYNVYAQVIANNTTEQDT